MILSGPSGVGKGPLQAAVQRLHPGLLDARPVLATSRAPRDGEIHGKHFYFLPRAVIQSLGDQPDVVVSSVRTDLQAIDLGAIQEMLASCELVFAETFHTFHGPLKAQATEMGLDVSTVFLHPVPLGTAADVIVNTMRDKLINRGTESSAKLAERAAGAAAEMTLASASTHRILNTAGEDDIEEWGEFGTRGGLRGTKAVHHLGDLGPTARAVVSALVGILRGDLGPGDYP